MMRGLSITALLLLAAVSAVGGIAPAPTAPSAWEFSGVSRVVAVGDLHGSPDKLVDLLDGAGMVDTDLRWTGGTDHLVVAGDILDRGAGDRQLLELLMRLEGESEAAGGRIHVLLGNHEAMNLMRDTRDVNPVSYESFAADETKGERRAAWNDFSRIGASEQDLSERNSEFNRRFPRGFFARQRMFEPDGRYGRWLMGLPTIVKINAVVYVHGGLTDDMAELGIEGINRGVRNALERHLEARAALERRQIVARTMSLGELREEIDRVLEQPVVETEVRLAAEAFIGTQDDPLLTGGGPLWYRGLSKEDERIERRRLDRALDLIGARAMVVAHSFTGGNRITSRFHGRLFRLDHGIVASDRPLALVVEQGEALVLDPRTHRKTRPIRELPPGGISARVAQVIPDEEQELFLSRAEVVDSRELGRGSTRPRLVRLELGGTSRRGIFKSVDERQAAESPGGADRFQHEIAAYRVDRMLGLGMVPVTVPRELDGERGSLQAWVDEAVDQAEASFYNLSLWEAETVRSQLARCRVFDALIGNHLREPTDILSQVRGSNIYLIDHSKAFSTATDLPAGADEGLEVTPRLATALSALDGPALAAALGGLLTDAQLDALLERKERILRLHAMAAGADATSERTGQR